MKTGAPGRPAFRSSTTGRSVECGVFSADGDSGAVEVEEDLSPKTLVGGVLDLFGDIPEPVLGLALGTAGCGGALNAANHSLKQPLYGKEYADRVGLIFACVGLLYLLWYSVKVVRFWKIIKVNKNNTNP